ncbi:MAG: radical SAM protein [Candidatus Hydrogenedentes bacterium]|nr:radical SAM protein [Candidatus Hydrogenedentota bacterium]
MSGASIEWMGRLAAWRSGGSAGPLRVTLFPTNRCNLRCSICWQRWADVDRTEMSDERLMRLVDECAELGVREWLIIGGGEPMVRGQIVMKMISRIRELGMNGGLHTNGTIFDQAHFEELIRVGWQRVTVSLDGPNEEINDSIRSKGSFAKATENIRKLGELKRQRNALLPGISLYVTLTKLTCDKVEDIIELSHALGCDHELSLSDLIVQGERCEELALTKDDWKTLRASARRAEILANRYGMSTNLACYAEDSGQPASSGLRPVQWAHGDPANAICYEPWLSLSILPDGKCGPCCAFYDPGADSLANLSLQEVWRGKYLEEVRRQLREKHPPDYCSRCPSNNMALANWQRQVYHEHEFWRRLTGARRFAYLARKGVQSIRKHGVLTSVKRGAEWVRLHRH